MTTLPRFFAGLCAALLAFPVAAFEGKVHFDMVTGKNTQPIVYSLKDDRARMEMPNMGMSMASILDGPKQKVFVLMPEQRMYMEMDLQDAVDAGNRVAKGKSKGNEVTFEDTGESEVILGRKCQKFRISDRDSTTEVWAADGMGRFAGQIGGRPGKGNTLPAWQKELASREFFPLRMIARDRKNKEVLRMQATKIEETSIADAAFEVPSDYQKFGLGGLMKGMIPGLK